MLHEKINEFIVVENLNVRLILYSYKLNYQHTIKPSKIQFFFWLLTTREKKKKIISDLFYLLDIFMTYTNTDYYDYIYI